MSLALMALEKLRSHILRWHKSIGHWSCTTCICLYSVTRLWMRFFGAGVNLWKPCLHFHLSKFSRLQYNDRSSEPTVEILNPLQNPHPTKSSPAKTPASNANFLSNTGSDCTVVSLQSCKINQINRNTLKWCRWTGWGRVQMRALRWALALWQSKGVCSYLCPSLSPSLCQSPSFPKERAWGPNLSHSNPGAKSKLSFVVLGSQQLPITGSAWLLGLSLPQHDFGGLLDGKPCCWWKTSSAIELNKYVVHGCFIPQNLHSFLTWGFLHPRFQKFFVLAYPQGKVLSCKTNHEPPPSFSSPAG